MSRSTPQHATAQEEDLDWRSSAAQGEGDAEVAIVAPRAFWTVRFIDSAVRPYIDCLRRDFAFHYFVAAYALLGLIVGILAGVPHKFVPLAYVSTTGILLAVIIGGGLWALLSGEPAQTLRRALTNLRQPNVVAGLLLFVSLSIYMGVFTSIKTMLTDIVPFFGDPFLADLDEHLHGQSPWLYTTAVLPPGLTPTLERLYFGIWGVLLPASVLAALFVPRLEHVRKQYIWTMLLTWSLLGNVIAGATMSAGPVYYQLVTHDPRFAGLLDYLARHSSAQAWGQAFLWKSYVSGEAGAGSGISAFPSMHLAQATLFVLLAGRIGRWLTGAAVAYCGIVLFGSVHLGWHYAVDGYFAIAATVLIWTAVGWALKSSPPDPGQERAPTPAGSAAVAIPTASSTARPLVDLRAYVECLRGDGVCHAFVACYTVGVWLVGNAAGASHKLLPLTFFAGAAQALSLVLLAALAGAWAWSFMASALPARVRQIDMAASGPALVSGVLLFLSLCVFLGVFSSMKQILTDIVPFFADPVLADLDASLHGQDAWRLTSAAMPVQLMPALEFLYLNCWGAGVIGCTLAVLFAPRLRKIRLQYVWSLLIIWTLLGNVIAGAAMSAGPIFYEHVTGGIRFEGLLGYLAEHSRQAWVQDFLWSAYSGNQPGKAGAGISAFPSMHVASATLCALVAANAHRWLRWPAIAYCAAIMFASVHLGWHYALDGYFSIAATLIIWLLVGHGLARGGWRPNERVR